MTAPFTKLARSDARNTISSAISSGAAARPRGMVETIAANASPRASVPGVLVGPGETALTRTPLALRRDRPSERPRRGGGRGAGGDAAGVVDERADAGGGRGGRRDGGGRREGAPHNPAAAPRRFDCRDHFGAARLTAAADQGMRSLARDPLTRNRPARVLGSRNLSGWRAENPDENPETGPTPPDRPSPHRTRRKRARRVR